MQRTPHPPFLRAALTTVGALALVGSTFTGTAFATGRDDAPGHARKADAAATRDHDGDADRSAATQYTEDTDTNDGGTPNGVADAGDDRHPSGTDRSVEHGRSGNQGKAESDPDDDGRGPDRGNGGDDKPNGTGGIDKADQDGNNGCGNDDDFEDDNEGWCGRKPHPAAAEKPAGVPARAEQPGKAKGRDKDEAKRHRKGDDVSAAPCPTGMVDANGPAVGGCETAATATGACPVGMADVNGSEAGGCVQPGVLGAEVALSAAARIADVPAGEVLASSAVAAPAEASPTVRAQSGGRPAILAAAVGGVTGALAFTGLNALTLLLVALVAIAVGWVLVRTGRTRRA